MGRVLYVIWAIVVTAVVTGINASQPTDNSGSGSYRSWGSGSGYTGGGGSHK
ncbi:hypothetical protein [Uliginosibacterium sp. H1]|uniref:hypothetical protein n=1 Tax=Uliginosibacterium sp. H1 TaxID=3114757 RepID=UPI002E19621C|nr:hypothetical protein [Uliginosibacterium sp. H1]